MIVVPLQAELRELGRIEGEVRRQAEPVGALGVEIERTAVSGHVLAAENRDPAAGEAAGGRGVEAVVVQRFTGKDERRLGLILAKDDPAAGLVAAVESLGLKADERPAARLPFGLPLPVDVEAIDLRIGV